MKHILQKYSLETFSFIILIILLIRFLFYPDLSAEHRILSAFMILAILHEFEEKRTPGGFFELMAKKFGLPAEQQLFEKAGLCVIVYLSVIFIAASLYPKPALILVPAYLGLFEAFIHTAGIWIHKLSKPYTPGLVTAWIMAAVSVYTIRYLAATYSIGAVTYILGLILFILSFVALASSVWRSFGIGISDIRKRLR